MLKPEPGVTALFSVPPVAVTLTHAQPAKSGVTKTTYLNVKAMQDSPSVRQLHQMLKPVTGKMLCSDVLRQFQENEDLAVLPVVDQNGRAYALIERYAYIEYFSRQYSNELFGKKRLDQLGEHVAFINMQPILVDAATTIDDVAAIIINAGMRHMVTGFVVTENGKYLGVGNGHDLLNHITQRKQAELYYLAHYDQLTQIPNRMLMNDRLHMACRDADRHKTLVAVMFIDVDRFKLINDTMGHRFGDLLLQAIAERLATCVRDNDTVARLGGDEFAVLLHDLELASDANITAQRIIESFCSPIHILDREVFITVSLGLAIYPTDERDSSNILAKADAAMYEAKVSGCNAYRVYQPGLSMHTSDQLSLEADLRYAIEREELVLHYQPQLNTANGGIVGVEALVRWKHPQLGLLQPSSFIEIAESSGMIVDIGKWVLREACQQQREWSLCQPHRLRMAVNISAVQFRREDFVDVVRTVIEETGVDPSYIELELTENVAMHNADNVMNILCELKLIGVQLAIDDFGTGFSNLSYLRRFPFDRLKIDQSFVRDIDKLPANRAIVHAIVSLARSLSLEVVAEGVETHAELAHMNSCDEVQGYLHARPMSAIDTRAWLAKR
ncbi:MAG: EAL domain-containing protein [Betaproteobacteria bacterium]